MTTKRKTVAAEASRGEESAKAALRDVRVLVFPTEKQQSPPVVIDQTDAEAKSDRDPFERLLHQDKIVDPPFDLFSLSVMPEHSSELNPNIEAMEVNVVGFGWKLKRLPGVKADDPGVIEEKERLDLFLKYGGWDGKALTAHRRRGRKDREATGNNYLELITNAKDEIVGFNHVPSFEMRLGTLDPEPQTFTMKAMSGEGDRRKVVELHRRRRFRRYVQAYRTRGSWKETWFKEFGDPRAISRDTGEVLTGKDAEDPAKLANQMVHGRIYSSRSPYGIPRWIGALLAITGSRSAEEINYNTFKNNNIPSMMVLVSNGQITQSSIDRLTQFTESVIQGSDNFSKFIVLEADPDDTTGGQVKIEVKPLTAEQHTDQLFQEYEKNNAGKVRRNFRMPPIVVGMSDEYTRATADTSRKLAEEQVFAPERGDEDWDMNCVLLSMNMHFHEFVTNTPNVTNDEDLIRVMAAAERSGGMTPRIAHGFLEDIVGNELAKVSDEIDPDIPFTAQMAQLVKNKAQPNEPGQQVTALKRMRGMSALRLGHLESRLVASGATNILELHDQIGPGTYAVVDGQEVHAAIELGEAEEVDARTWRYPVVRRMQVGPAPYVATSGDGETVIESIYVP